MGRLLIGLTLLAATFGPPAEARAQAETREYRQLIRRAMREFNDGRFEEARALFHQAHELTPNARTARGIGMASFELRDYVAAEAALDEALASTTRPLTRDMRAATEDLLSQTRGFLGRYLFIVDPSSASLTVDDAVPPSRLDGMVLLPIGEHVIRVEAAGFAPFTRRIRVTGGESETVQIALRGEGEPEPDDSPVAEGGGGDDTLFLAGLVTLAAAAAPLGMMFGGVGWMVDRDGEVARCRDVLPTQRCVNGDVLESEQSASVAFTVTTGVLAGLAAGVGLTMLLLGMGGGADEQAARCAPTLGGLSCAGRF